MLRRRSTVALAAIGALSSLPAHALDGGGAKQVIDKFLATQGDAQGSAQAAQHVVADINADGKPDIVLMWNYLGPRSLSDLISRVRRRRFSRRARRTTQPIARLSASRPTPPCAKSAPSLRVAPTTRACGVARLANIPDIGLHRAPCLRALWAQRIARNQVRQAPSYHYPKLTLFLDAGRNYRTLTTDLDGQTERLSVKGSAITVDTLTLGPNDPRCCPTRKTQMHFRWQGGKLVALR